jgi:broad specificity phosphatase PhoE
MLELWLIRHGETDWNHIRRWQGHTDIPLNAAGIRQAATLARRLQRQTFDAVYSSDLGRTRATAALAMPGATPILDPRLREMHFGSFEGKSWSEMSAGEQAEIDAWWENPYENRIAGGESFRDLERRLVEWRRSLPAPGRYLVFTHGGPIRSLLWEVLGPPRRREWTILLSNAGLTRLSYEQERVTLVTVNDCAHLDEPEREPKAPGEAPSYEETPAQ